MHSLLIIFCLINYCSSSFVSSNAKITELQSTNRAFVGFHNNTIYILGGVNSETNIITFPLDVTWIQANTSNTFGYQLAQSSVQINQQIWMLPFGQKTLNVFDMNEEKIVETISFNGAAIKSRCITNYLQFILVIGGADNTYFTEFNIYNISNQEWTAGKSINTKRGRHSCNVVGSTLYVIGGVNSNHLKSVEYSSFNGLTETFNKWTTMTATLSTKKSRHRSVVFGSDIFVLGGQDSNNNALDQIDIINTITKTISSPNTNHLVYAKYDHSAIIINGIIYCFAGNPISNNEYYQYAVIPTVSPSTSPITYHPSTSPTLYPTTSPINSPTSSPSISPTFSPTIASNSPSTSPTTTPTSSPSVAPTLSPIIPPTTTPTLSPSIAPTFSPTIASNSPSTPPTIAPTSAPISSLSVAPTNPTHTPTITSSHSIPIISNSDNVTDKKILWILVAIIIGLLVCFVAFFLKRRIRSNLQRIGFIDGNMPLLRIQHDGQGEGEDFQREGGGTEFIA